MPVHTANGELRCSLTVLQVKSQQIAATVAQGPPRMLFSELCVGRLR